MVNVKLRAPNDPEKVTFYRATGATYRFRIVLFRSLWSRRHATVERIATTRPEEDDVANDANFREKCHKWNNSVDKGMLKAPEGASMSYLTILSGIAGVHILAIASPGPTLAVVLSYAVRGNRRAGLQLAFGVVLATMAWATAAAAGLNTALASFPSVYRTLQLAGAAYLVYLGVKLLVATYRGGASSHALSKTPTVSGWQAVRTGFVTNITNPKVIAYYASLFGVLIPSTAPAWLFWAAVTVVIVVSGFWWTGISLVLTNGRIRGRYERAQPALDGLMGVVLVALGLKLALWG